MDVIIVFGKVLAVIPPFLVILLLIVGPIYLLPSIVAALRNHRELPVVIMLNFCLGWTFIGWVIALAWGSMGPRKGPLIIAVDGVVNVRSVGYRRV